MVENLRKVGVEVEEFEDGYKIKGTKNIKKATINSYGDHRIAMSFAILGMINGIKILKAESINTSFPGFFNLFSKIAEFEVRDDN